MAISCNPSQRQGCESEDEDVGAGKRGLQGPGRGSHPLGWGQVHVALIKRFICVFNKGILGKEHGCRTETPNMPFYDLSYDAVTLHFTEPKRCVIYAPIVVREGFRKKIGKIVPF